MGKFILAYDLGTGGSKASLYNKEGRCITRTFIPYDTLYPDVGWHEQRPNDWWNAVVESTRRLLKSGEVKINDIECLALSGQSLGVVPIDRKGKLLRETVPIWSDTRTPVQTSKFFRRIQPTEWYMLTGNGFSKECYSVFKIMWYRDNEPDMFSRIHRVLGSKDYINYRLTGELCTDYSYASGSGIYNLKEWRYEPRLVQASGLSAELFPEIVPSTQVIGTVTRESAETLGLSTNVNPVVNCKIKPFVFTHVIPNMFTSATAIFSAGNSLRWVRDTLCKNIKDMAERENRDPYEMMTELAAESPAGARKLLFNPSLAGGSAAHLGPQIRGAFLGLDLSHTQADVIRAVLEGISFDLRIMLDKLAELCALSEEVILVGGGSKSKLWRQIFANVFDRTIVKTNVDQDAASLGAAAVAAVGTEIWKNFNIIDEILIREDVEQPQNEVVRMYNDLLPLYASFFQYQSKLGRHFSALMVPQSSEAEKRMHR